MQPWSWSTGSWERCPHEFSAIGSSGDETYCRTPWKWGHWTSEGSRMDEGCQKAQKTWGYTYSGRRGTAQKNFMLKFCREHHLFLSCFPGSIASFSPLFVTLLFLFSSTPMSEKQKSCFTRDVGKPGVQAQRGKFSATDVHWTLALQWYPVGLIYVRTSKVWG